MPALILILRNINWLKDTEYRQTPSPHRYELAHLTLSIGEIQWPSIFYFIKNCGKTKAHVLYNVMALGFGLKIFNLTIRYGTLWFWNLHWTQRHLNVTGYKQGYMLYKRVAAPILIIQFLSLLLCLAWLWNKWCYFFTKCNKRSDKLFSSFYFYLCTKFTLSVLCNRLITQVRQ